MTDWQKVIDAGFQRPDAGVTPELIAELSEALRSPDPVLRDEQAFTVLARWIPELDSGQRHRLGDEMAARFTDPEIQARTFAPLILAGIVEADDFDEAWLSAFTRWYPAETDVRGYDPELGWLHAVAHGADLLGTFGRCRQADPAPLLDVAAARLLAPTDHVFAAQEDDRLAYAVALTLTRTELSQAQSVNWLDPVRAGFEAGEPGPVPAHASNTMRTLRALYILADRGVRPQWNEGDPLALTHRDAVRQRLADVLALVAPMAG
ncbi:MAG TPA: DUF2785 domain-containing protein [Streptosporangiaceae bacterium]|jgi:hypothetical protein|nr:DUF2785 domain-containing protein [Streptosporangiaceae bacterium]